MDFSWSDEQLAFKQRIINFAKNELNSSIVERKCNCLFEKMLWQRSSRFGIKGIAIPEKYGGLRADPGNLGIGDGRVRFWLPQ